MINCEFLVMFTLLPHQCLAATYVLIHSVNLTFGPKVGFKIKCRVRTDLGFEHEPHLQL